MTDNNRHNSNDESIEADGGVATQAVKDHQNTDYLRSEVNLLKPGTPFMRDHLRVIWTGFVTWALIVFGPVILTAIAPDAMSTELPVIEFPLHYFLVAIGAPGGTLLLSAWYARKRDQLDTKYGIEHTSTTETGRAGGGGTAATDGGATE